MTDESYDNSFRIRPLLRDLTSRGSKPEIIEYEDPVTGEIKKKVRMTRRKFGPAEQLLFLEEYSKWGRMGEAAHAAGVSTPTVRHYLSEDEDFMEAFLEAEGVYKDKLIAHHQSLIFEGIEKNQYDRNGNLIATTKEYPIRLIELELKKHDEGYRDKREVKHDINGGVLVAPSNMESIEDWETKFAEMKDVTPRIEEEEDD